MTEFDDTNRGAMFKPFESQAMILSGKINVDGTDDRFVFVKNQTQSGKNIIEVYQKVGALFAKEADASANAPDYSGPMDKLEHAVEWRIAAWKKEKDGKRYMSISVSPKHQDNNAPVNLEIDDDIPF